MPAEFPDQGGWGDTLWSWDGAAVFLDYSQWTWLLALNASTSSANTSFNSQRAPYRSPVASWMRRRMARPSSQTPAQDTDSASRPEEPTANDTSRQVLKARATRRGARPS